MRSEELGMSEVSKRSVYQYVEIADKNIPHS